MAITLTTPSPGKFGWIVNGTSADASGCEILVAAPGAGIQLIVDQLTINCGSSAITITIGQGVSAGAVEVALLGPISFAANTSLQFTFQYGMWLLANKSLTVDTSGAGNICIFVQGRTI